MADTGVRGVYLNDGRKLMAPGPIDQQAFDAIADSTAAIWASSGAGRRSYKRHSDRGGEAGADVSVPPADDGGHSASRPASAASTSSGGSGGGSEHGASDSGPVDAATGSRVTQRGQSWSGCYGRTARTEYPPVHGRAARRAYDWRRGQSPGGHVGGHSSDYDGRGLGHHPLEEPGHSHRLRPSPARRYVRGSSRG